MRAAANTTQVKSASNVWGRGILPVIAFVLLLLSASCRSSRHTTKPDVNEGGNQIESSESFNDYQKKILDEAYTWIGTPYAYAKMEKGKGTDCSGMVMSVFNKAVKIDIPRNSAKQAEFCTKVKEKDVQVADLVFFATGSNPERISHVGIIVNKDSFIHASSSKGVIVSNLHSPYYEKRLIMYGRVPHETDKPK